MSEVKWFKTTQEMHNYVRAEARGQAGEEYKPKEVAEPVTEAAEPAKATKKTKKGAEDE